MPIPGPKRFYAHHGTRCIVAKYSDVCVCVWLNRFFVVNRGEFINKFWIYELKKTILWAKIEFLDKNHIFEQNKTSHSEYSLQTWLNFNFTQHLLFNASILQLWFEHDFHGNHKVCFPFTCQIYTAKFAFAQWSAQLKVIFGPIIAVKFKNDYNGRIYCGACPQNGQNHQRNSRRKTKSGDHLRLLIGIMTYHVLFDACGIGVFFIFTSGHCIRLI